jgi:hypothetical protein
LKTILNVLRTCCILPTITAILTVPTARVASAQQDDVAVARRLAAVASIALSEYGEGVVGGRVVLPEELKEAQLFLNEALAVALVWVFWLEPRAARADP